MVCMNPAAQDAVSLRSDDVRWARYAAADLTPFTAIALLQNPRGGLCYSAQKHLISKYWRFTKQQRAQDAITERHTSGKCKFDRPTNQCRHSTSVAMRYATINGEKTSNTSVATGIAE
ncbi:hypothetical protein ZIOFF_032425 [Zingiber officinale]|uniref:Uncharacterized protein n=1 Tax=Zingiber officinale TaxID=94328 RepID=A0A8J5GVF3_ZINOF|nr:hypothetical protein ZIOFF_032425 [Zingiber officinale]